MNSDPIEVAAEVIEPADALQVTCAPAVIDDNLAALDAYVERRIAPFVGAEIDPADCDQVKLGRKIMAELNDLKRPIDAERKRVKAEYEAPLKAFEERVTAITSKIDAARDGVKRQVDDADARFRKARRALLKEEYEGCAGVLAGIVPFDAVLDHKWLNRSITDAAALNKLYAKAEEAARGYEALALKDLRHKDEVIKHYVVTLDMVAALEVEDRMNRIDRELEEFKAARRAAEAVKAERTAQDVGQEGPSVQASAPGGAASVADEPQSAAPVAARPQPPVCRWSLDMEFRGTEGFARQVAAALKGMGITGASIKCMGVVSNG
ncbi:DUF1351 domain-containing protein [Eggerthellaceae bacterium zg-893]|nr:DUF1351 domain-containing protein [Eggerthellaceae bacterium zg-893]